MSISNENFYQIIFYCIYLFFAIVFVVLVVNFALLSYTICMEQKLSTNISQRLALNAKLQQAVRLLQMSTVELRTAIEKEYMENPLLEVDDTSMNEEEGFLSEKNTDELPALIDYLDGDELRQGYAAEEHESGAEAVTPMAITLEQELLEQAKFVFHTDRELEIATFIIGSLDDRGYLATELKEASRVFKASDGEILKVLRRIQAFEPAGVGARNLGECLRIQAERLGVYDGLVETIITRHLEDVAQARIKQIAKDEGCSPEDVQAAVDLLRTLNPKPGSAYGGDEVSCLFPEVRIQKENGEYTVIMNDNYTPRLYISNVYKQEARHGDPVTREYIRKRLDSASWLIRNIEQRRDTILNVVKEIVRRQTDFLDNGPGCLKPMTMRMVAEAIGVHESTVSRAVSGKYVQLPRGVLPLRSFFSAHTMGESGQEGTSADQAKAAIKKFLGSEDSKHPLSDQKLAELLESEGLSISRRTVMKYREQMGYASSAKRKRF